MTVAASDLVLDCNAIAGMLEELFGVDMTTTRRSCGSCGRTHELGRYRLYRSAGLVLRCPTCGAEAARIAQLPDRVVMQLASTDPASPKRRRSPRPAS
jgi:predicted RNA-binding Zn-ribbon protein involved in translation (DUF1610 family)